MTTGVGVIGCGNISPNYIGNARMFSDIEIRAVSDLNDELASARSAEFGVDKTDLPTMLARPDIDIILNLTPPVVHAGVSRQSMAAGKHVYSEKPLSISFDEGKALHEEAEARGLVLAVAPDTFLGASHQAARALIDRGEVGRIVGGAGFFLSPGMESWHPNPAFFFKKGGGPLFDMAPYYLTSLVNLLGPVERVISMAGMARSERLVTSEGPMSGNHVSVEVPTTYWSVLAFKCGTQFSLGVSWDVTLHSLPHIELYGTAGTIRLADPDQFGGSIHIGKTGGWLEIPSDGQLFGGPEGTWTDHRILGLVDMAAAIREKREPRASSGRALHILEVIEALTVSATAGRAVEITTTCTRARAFDAADVRLK